MTTGKKVERPLQLGARVYKKHRQIIKKWVKNKKIKFSSDADFTRQAIESFDNILTLSLQAGRDLKKHDDKN